MTTKQEVIYVLIVCIVVQVTSKVPVVCHKKTYNEWKVDLHHRFDEVSSFDCAASNCGGQCVALVKCACGAPWTGYWSPGLNVIEQACTFGTRYVEYTAASSYYHRFSVVMTDQSHMNPGHHCSWRYTGC